MTSSINSNGVADANDPQQHLTIPPTEDSQIDQEFGIFVPLPPTNHSVHEGSSMLVLDFDRKADESPSGSYNAAPNMFTYVVGNEKQIQQVDIPRSRPRKKQPLLSPKGQDVYRSPIYNVLTQDLQQQRQQQQTKGNGAGETQDARLDNRTVSQKCHKTGSHLADNEGREEISTNKYEADIPNELPQPQKKRPSGKKNPDGTWRKKSKAQKQAHIQRATTLSPEQIATLQLLSANSTARSCIKSSKS